MANFIQLADINRQYSNQLSLYPYTKSPEPTSKTYQSPEYLIYDADINGSAMYIDEQITGDEWFEITCKYTRPKGSVTLGIGSEYRFFGIDTGNRFVIKSEILTIQTSAEKVAEKNTYRFGQNGTESFFEIVGEGKRTSKFVEGGVEGDMRIGGGVDFFDVYAVKVYRNNRLIKDLVPIITENGEVGMGDKKTGSLYFGSTTNWKYGGEMSEVKLPVKK